MAGEIDAATLKAWLSDGAEIALLDVREAGQFGESHLFFAVPLPYSRLEIGLPALVPNPGVRVVLCDGGDGIAGRAAARAEVLGYRNVHVLAGGTPAWGRAGYTLYAGVNVPSKTFGELVEHERHTPRVTPEELAAMRKAGENIVIVDGRPFSEYRRMSIPGGICCPNGELVLRIGDIAPDPNTKIIVNCAGRTRSIIGAQTLIDFGVANPVYALENGTQGWRLAGLQLEHGASRRHGAGAGGNIAALAARARKVGEARGVAFLAAADVEARLAESTRTTYLFDVRTPEEFTAGSAPGFVHAPGGQLIQATDQWVGVRGARLVLADKEGVRAPVVAAWLRQLGYEACVLEGGIAAARRLALPGRAEPPATPALPAVPAGELAGLVRDGGAVLLDLRPSMTFRRGHPAGARWSIRPRIAGAVPDRRRPVVLIAEEPELAALAALDLQDAGCRDVRLLAGGEAAWREAGLSMVATPDEPADADCIDYLFFTHRRHDEAEASRQYLAWETGLIAQLDSQERAAFRISPPG